MTPARDDTDERGVPTVRIVAEEPVVDSVLRDLQLIALKHPEAFRSGLRALMAEGRRFGATPEGARWRQRLERSALLNRAALIWQHFAAGPDGEDVGVTPSNLLEAFFRMAAAPIRDRLLDRWLRGSMRR